MGEQVPAGRLGVQQKGSEFVGRWLRDADSWNEGLAKRLAGVI